MGNWVIHPRQMVTTALYYTAHHWESIVMHGQSVVAVNYCSNGLWWQSIRVLIAYGGSH